MQILHSSWLPGCLEDVAGGPAGVDTALLVLTGVTSVCGIGVVRFVVVVAEGGAAAVVGPLSVVRAGLLPLAAVEGRGGPTGVCTASVVELEDVTSGVVAFMTAGVWEDPEAMPTLDLLVLLTAGAITRGADE